MWSMNSCRTRTRHPEYSRREMEPITFSTAEPMEYHTMRSRSLFSLRRGGTSAFANFCMFSFSMMICSTVFSRITSKMSRISVFHRSLCSMLRSRYTTSSATTRLQFDAP